MLLGLQILYIYFIACDILRHIKWPLCRYVFNFSSPNAFRCLGLSFKDANECVQLGEGRLELHKKPWFINKQSHHALWDVPICWSSPPAVPLQNDCSATDSSVVSIPKVNLPWSNYTVGQHLINKLKQCNQSSQAVLSGARLGELRLRIISKPMAVQQDKLLFLQIYTVFGSFSLFAVFSPPGGHKLPKTLMIYIKIKINVLNFQNIKWILWVYRSVT